MNSKLIINSFRTSKLSKNSEILSGSIAWVGGLVLPRAETIEVKPFSKRERGEVKQIKLVLWAPAGLFHHLCVGWVVLVLAGPTSFVHLLLYFYFYFLLI